MGRAYLSCLTTPSKITFLCVKKQQSTLGSMTMKLYIDEHGKERGYYAGLAGNGSGTTG